MAGIAERQRRWPRALRRRSCPRDPLSRRQLLRTHSLAQRMARSAPGWEAPRCWPPRSPVRIACLRRLPFESAQQALQESAAHQVGAAGRPGSTPHGRCRQTCCQSPATPATQPARRSLRLPAAAASAATSLASRVSACARSTRFKSLHSCSRRHARQEHGSRRTMGRPSEGGVRAAGSGVFAALAAGASALGAACERPSSALCSGLSSLALRGICALKAAMAPRKHHACVATQQLQYHFGGFCRGQSWLMWRRLSTPRHSAPPAPSTYSRAAPSHSMLSRPLKCSASAMEDLLLVKS